jgi:hypothetical protein
MTHDDMLAQGWRYWQIEELGKCTVCYGRRAARNSVRYVATARTIEEARTKAIAKVMAEEEDG